MTAVIASLLPIALYLFALKIFDSFGLIRWNRLGISFAYGAAVCLASFLFVRYSGFSCEISGFSFMPVVEELLKFGLMAYFVASRKIRFLSETLIYGAAVGGGFSFLENIAYLSFNAEYMSLGSALFRGFGCAILHIGCTALAASLMLMISQRQKLWLSMLLSPIPSIILHLVHNMQLVNPQVQLAVVILLFLSIFILLFDIGEKRIYKWMDHSISTDIQTLSAIRQGNFAATKAGTYLLSVKEQFSPAVFFDMICYVQTYLEAKIEKQSYMLLCQAGFEGADASFDLEGHKAKIAELEGLRKNIGRTACYILSPIVKESANSLSLSN